MGNLLLANGLSLVFTTAALVALTIGPRRWRLTALWVYLTVVEGMTLGLVMFGPPTVGVAQALELIRVALVAAVALQVGADAVGRAPRWGGAPQRWTECLFQCGCYVGIGAVLIYASIVHGRHPPAACYREIGLADFCAAAVLLTVAWRMREEITAAVDEWTVYGLGATYSLYATYRLLRQFDETLAQVFGWLGTLAYCATLAAIALAALDDWHER